MLCMVAMHIDNGTPFSLPEVISFLFLFCLPPVILLNDHKPYQLMDKIVYK